MPTKCLRNATSTNATSAPPVHCIAHSSQSSLPQSHVGHPAAPLEPLRAELPAASASAAAARRVYIHVHVHVRKVEREVGEGVGRPTLLRCGPRDCSVKT